MEEKISKKLYLFITAATSFFITLNTLSWQNPSIGLAAGFIYTLFCSYILGSIFISRKGWEIFFGFILTIAYFSIIGGLFIFALSYSDYAFILSIILLPAILITPYYNARFQQKFSLKKTVKNYFSKYFQRKEPKYNSTLVIIYLILITACYYILSLGHVDYSIQSPWQVLPIQYFLVYFFATLVLLTYLFNATRTKLPLILITIHSFASVAVALFIYKIGFGFDPFIHQAAEKIIGTTGTITPKTFYYLGQYGVILSFYKMTFVGLELLDKILVPVLFALFLPSTIYYVFSHWLEKRFALALSLSILTIPFTGFIMTAPQNLANLYFIITILLSLLYFRNDLNVIVLYILAASTLITHPLAGIPLLIALFLFNLFKIMYSSYKHYVGLYFFAGLVFVIFLPLAFIVNGSSIITTLPDITRADVLWASWINNFNLKLDIVYLYQLNKILLGGLVTIAGVYFIFKNKLLKNNTAYLMAAFVIYLDFLIIKFGLTFPALRDFDLSSFVSRLFTLSFYILIPFFLLGLYLIYQKFWDKGLFFKFALLILISLSLTTSMYLSYPRLDGVDPAKFYSLSQSDINAVKYIEHSATPNHIVLANQMVGVAAIKEFGFKRYYDNQFFYSMPNGENRSFYEAYLGMIYEGAKRETIEKAMEEAGVSEGYFVLNKYWKDSEKIAKKASEEADKIIFIDNGAITIFKYNLN